jgi:hypothetical protein
MKNEQNSVAFAMGGLAGNNAHGAGFLHAALEKEVKPIMISCTSGQILWVSRYLQVANSLGKGNLEEMLQEDVHSMNPTGNVNVALASLALYGKPGVFAPARSEYMWDMVRNAMDSWRDVCTKPHEVLLPQKLLELFPCRNLLPDFPVEFFEKIADTFRHASLPQENGKKRLQVGIVFNSYNPRSGEEYVYLNDQARKLLQEKSSDEEHKYDQGKKSTYRDRTIYQNIDAKAVRDALWLYQYGFDKKENGFIDGAYFRGMILSELTVADRIFCVRPINHLWQGDLPRNYPELEDLKTEIGFDGSYCGERYQIQLVNRLLGKNVADSSKYHQIELEEIEIKKPRGYFDYLFENEQVFADAYEDATQRFDRLAAKSAVPA